MKENELFEEKLKLQEKVAKMKNNGSSWLELLFNESAALGEFELSLCSAVCGGALRSSG
ncbi:MAG: hypothetical protein AAB542_03995 [Patescibacteria group bacterium]